MAQTIKNPFSYKMIPALYPQIAAWYEKDADFFKTISEALQAAKDAETNLTSKLRLDAYLKPLNPLVNDKQKPLEELEDLYRYSKFFREIKIQAGCAGGDMPDKMRGDIRKLLEEHLGLIQPKAVFSTMPCAFSEQGFLVEGMEEPIHSTSLKKFFTTRAKKDVDQEYAGYEKEKSSMPPPDQCVLFAATIGPGVDDQVERYLDQQENYKALLLNSIGAGAADMIAMDLELYANHELFEPSKQHTWRRFHVGYGDFVLKWQKQLFQVIDPSCIQIQLNESCIMLPEKSVSGIIAKKRSA